jgi:release factor glutamine methyltransferase
MTNAHSIKTTLSLAATQLKAQGIDAETAKLEAQLLLQHVLKVNRAWLIAHENDALEANIHASFRALLQRRLNGEPIAYILGYREFYGLHLKVSADTLIPRADTETLVEAALVKIDLLLSPSPLAPLPQAGEGNKAANLSPSPASGRGVGERGDFAILDLGTGTGAIALAIAKHHPKAHVTALDASQAALAIAIENADNLNITNVNFILSDWFSAIKNEKFDIIVSNPPYIEAADAHLKQGDLRFEPLSALASGADGLDDIRHIIDHCLAQLKPQGWLMLEHGYNQAELVANLMAKVGLTHIETVKDLAGNPRVSFGKNPLILSANFD